MHACRRAVKVNGRHTPYHACMHVTALEEKGHNPNDACHNTQANPKQPQHSTALAYEKVEVPMK
eukprot:m.202426 g.202426  ORF g.202426 m.202426 type:complete len:64 (-) comp17064_c0_seq25:1125-1316(-)